MNLVQTKIKANHVAFINSLFIGIIAACFVVLFQISFNIFIGKIFGYQLFLTNSTIYYNIPTEKWTQQMVIILYSIPFIAQVILLLFFGIIFFNTIEYNGYLRIFLAWGFIFTLSFMVGNILFGCFIYEGFGIVLSYLYMGIVAKIIVASICLFILLMIAFFMYRYLLLTANIYYLTIKPEKFNIFLLYHYLLPSILISALMYIAIRPSTFFNYLMLIVPVVFVLLIFTNTTERHKMEFSETENDTLSYKILIAPIIIAVALLVFTKYFLHINTLV